MRPIHGLVGVVCGATAILLTQLEWVTLTQIGAPVWFGLFVLVALGLLAEYQALTIQVTSNQGTSTVTFLPCLTALLLLGTPAAVLYTMVMGAIGEFGFRRKDFLRGTFNTAQYGLSMVLAGWMFHWAEGIPQAEATSFQVQPMAFTIAAITFLGMNQLFVSLAIAINEGQAFRRVLRVLVSQSGTNLFYDVLISPIAVCMAYVFVEMGFPGLIVSGLPLLFIRNSYMVNLALQRTNRALLAALVKAIETRDQYTSGHSLRVSSLSTRIGEKMGVTGRKLETIETAALLHDIGKIEAIYTDILKKPDHLSEEERKIIESHVTKGVELLNSLSSFPKPVIDSVRYHHEREDGRGYPDGIAGHQIPLGARIIKVVDAIDAMLSDRPYRRALTLDKVRSELSAHSGTQFNQEVVEVVLQSRILEEHAEELRASRPELPAAEEEAMERDVPQSPPATVGV
ncbi:MAG: HD-GYP domain-containing protein [Gemmatimonadetes bacterium]|nr:HD-GYP domain-containing protein [Gemmatimonadota bacterium]